MTWRVACESAAWNDSLMTVSYPFDSARRWAGSYTRPYSWRCAAYFATGPPLPGRFLQFAGFYSNSPRQRWSN
jgi:hypothetical protein